ncbi:MAG: spore germination protein [Eubacteriales bacterium]|nr:spore germination protein [Eubacteriales bacterium]
MENKYYFFRSKLYEALPIGQSFDIFERKLVIAGHDAHLYYVEGLVNGTRMQLLLSYLLDEASKKPAKMESAEVFINEKFPFSSTTLTDDPNVAAEMLLKGLVPIVIDGLDKIIVADVRNYPSRSVEEPSKEKSLRGAKDGFTETFMTNVALVRRRIRSGNLVFESHIIGSDSATDIALVYMKDSADMKLVEKLGKKLDSIDARTMTVAEQSVVEALMRDETKKKRGLARFAILNPFPKVRYTQRPDVVAAHVTEGRLAILVDNSPTALLLPASVFDFMQEVDDYYFPIVTGNYFRVLRIINLIAVVFASPLFFLMAEGHIKVYEAIRFFIPDMDFAISIFWQFVLIELAIDALKFASLNTPDSLGMSLSVIGALILGEFSIESGWFIPQTILVMAVVTLGSFAFPSIEMGYAVKVVRLIILIGAAIFGLWGAIGASIFCLIVMASTKTLVGTSYLYPLIPYNKDELKKVIFRTAQKRKN